MTVGIIEMDIHKCQFKGCMEFCKHFNRDKNLLWYQYFTNTPGMLFLLFKNVKWIIHSSVVVLKLFVMC